MNHTTVGISTDSAEGVDDLLTKITLWGGLYANAPTKYEVDADTFSPVVAVINPLDGFIEGIGL